MMKKKSPEFETIRNIQKQRLVLLARDGKLHSLKDEIDLYKAEDEEVLIAAGFSLMILFLLIVISTLTPARTELKDVMETVGVAGILAFLPTLVMVIGNIFQKYNKKWQSKIDELASQFSQFKDAADYFSITELQRIIVYELFPLAEAQVQAEEVDYLFERPDLEDFQTDDEISPFDSTPSNTNRRMRN